MHTNLWFWIAFHVGVLSVLAIDLFGFQRKAHAPSTKEAAIWTAVWVTLSLGFNALIWYWEGYAKALEFLTGYLVEYSLSVDNIFVFVLVFSYFAVPAAIQFFERLGGGALMDRNRRLVAEAATLLAERLSTDVGSPFEMTGSMAPFMACRMTTAGVVSPLA